MLSLPLLALTAACALLYFSIAVWKAMTYWKVRGVKHIPPWPIVGNLARLLKMDKHWIYFYDEVYSAYPNERMVGMYEFMTPTLVLRDPELIEQVLVRDFSTYQDHGPFIIEKDSILVNSVFAMGGKRWRAIRNKLLPSFSTGKMKAIFPQIVASCEALVDDKPETITKDLITGFAVKSFMNSMFGTKIVPTSEKVLLVNCKKIFEPTVKRMFQQYALTYFPTFSHYLCMTFLPRDLENYFYSLLNTLLCQRDNVSLYRDDYAQILVEMRKLEKMNIYNRENNKIDETFEITNELALAQAFMFFFAGLDTTTLVMLRLALELSLAKECQEKARCEVRSVLKKYGGYSWEAVREMKYLDQCIQETMRLHPSLPFLVRVCDKETELGGIKIKKNTRIVVPVYSIQMDPNHYPNPNIFDPNRFLESNLPRKFTFLPFSDGPRVCLGKRFATMEIATLFAHILDNFELQPSSQTKLPLEYEPNVFLLGPSTANPISIFLKKTT